MPVDVGQSAFEAVVIVSQALVVQAEEVEDGRMEIIYGGDILFRLPAKGISGTIRMAPLNTGAGGNPCITRYNRRINVRLSARGLNSNPFDSSRTFTKASIGCINRGEVGHVIFLNAQ